MAALGRGENPMAWRSLLAWAYLGVCWESLLKVCWRTSYSGLYFSSGGIRQIVGMPTIQVLLEGLNQYQDQP